MKLHSFGFFHRSLGAWALCLLTTAAAQAATVKVTSMTSTQVNQGSGWLVDTIAGPFIITSEHVLHADGVSARQRIEIAGQQIPAHVVLTDWGRGIAILSPDAPVPGGSTSDLRVEIANSPSAVQVGSTVTIEGFPSEQSGEPLRSTGEVATLQSRRPFLPMTTGIELTNSRGEFGMSGGPVFVQGQENAQGFVGILSHQVLKIIADQVSQVTASAAGDPSRNLFVIPREVVLQDLRDVMAGRSQPSMSAALSRVTNATGATLIRAGNLTFRELSRTQIQSAARGGVDGGGAGIGGDENAGRTQLVVEIALNPTLGNANGAWPAHLQNTLAVWNRKFLQRQTVRVIGFLSREPGQNRFRRTSVASLEEFTALLWNPQYRPLVDSGDGTPTADGKEQQIASLVSQIRKNAQDLKTAVGSQDAGLLDQVNLLLDLTHEDTRPVLKTDDFSRLVDTRGEWRDSWKALFLKSFDVSVGLMRDLNSLSDLCLK